VKAGRLNAEFLNAESEFAAMSVAIGASAAGARAYTAKSLRRMLQSAADGALEPMSFLDLDTALAEREVGRMRTTRRSGPSAENMLRDLGVTASGIG